ncbi:hypothetical protein NT6N_08960 [Oceaniferula spumae]|uniref:Signal transduction histidine kinase subgroup 3 dimerisation and phosphoacceptor domain-containing protein n=1 Tax=Oceaniferula spumae TaxID=2979115 RepID=A0AAT9FIG9_9BACT
MTALLAGALPSFAVTEDSALGQLKQTELEQRLKIIDAELSQLARTSLRGGVGSIGFRSIRHKTSDNTEWVEIDFGKEYSLDEIILVPTIHRDPQKGFQADGFPDRFQIIYGTSNNKTGSILGEFNATSDSASGIAPYVVACHGVKASWIRIEATSLTQRAFDKHYVFQLSEVLVFSGEKNVALRQPVKASSDHPESLTGAWDNQFLVDGHTPYLMNAAQGLHSVAYISDLKQSPILTIDLEKAAPITSLHLHAVEQSDTVPQAYAGDLGIPHHLRIEGANLPDFSDAVILLESQAENINDTGPIMMWNIPETTCRYVRLSEIDPSDTFRIGFAEIELFSNNHNVAHGKTVSTTGTTTPNRSLSALTDGCNLYGEILPIRTWLKQLARRQALEAERPLVMNELSLRYARQKTTLRRISWFAAILLLATVIVIWLEQIARQRAIARTRERIAANLHDELGANLHAIGLLGDFAKKIVARKNATDEWAELTDVIDEVRALTEETGETARYCTNMLETKEIHANLVTEMKRTTNRLLADLEHETSFPSDETSLHQLKPRRRIDLYLFYKECLTNIIRHSGATSVKTNLTATDKAITLTVSDNGMGLPGTKVPESLRRRARQLSGIVVAEALDTGGTQITLEFRPRRRFGFNRN